MRRKPSQPRKVWLVRGWTNKGTMHLSHSIVFGSERAAMSYVTRNRRWLEAEGYGGCVDGPYILASQTGSKADP